jgi:hypothetical protein
MSLLDSILRHDRARWHSIRSGDHERREAERKLFDPNAARTEAIRRGTIIVNARRIAMEAAR